MRRLALITAALALTVPVATAAGAVRPIEATESQPLGDDFIVAAFTDGVSTPNSPCLTEDNYSATIDWGDGTTSPASIDGPVREEPALPCRYRVIADHTYAEEADSLPVVVSVSGGNLNPDPLVMSGTATVDDAPLTAQTGAPISATAGVPWRGAVAAFVDSDDGATVGDYTARINWGDGSATVGGTIAPTSTPGLFTVSGSHGYAQAGRYTVSVTVRDAGGSTSAPTNVATVAPSPLGPVGPVAPGSPPSSPPVLGSVGVQASTQAFALTLGPVRFTRGALLAVRVGCPSSELTCRGHMLIYRQLGKRQQLGSVLFVLAGGTSSTLDIGLPRAIRSGLVRAHSARIAVLVVAIDPSTGRAGSGRETTLVQFSRSPRRAKHRARRRAHKRHHRAA
jgi:hypothetical protein